MAPALEPLTLSRSYALSSPVFSQITVSSIPSFSGRRPSISLPRVGGLKIKPTNISQSIESVNSRARFTRRTGSGSIVCEAQKTAVQVPDVEDGTWQSFVLESDVPVLVEFTAPWCGPCRMIHPIVDDLAKEYAGKFKFYKVNTDNSPSIATQYGIRSIPTVIIFKDGEKKEAIIGAVPKSTLTTSIEKFL